MTRSDDLTTTTIISTDHMGDAHNAKPRAKLAMEASKSPLKRAKEAS